MIRAHRRVHMWSTTVLLLIVSVIFVAGLAVRVPPARTDVLPVPLDSSSVLPNVVVDVVHQIGTVNLDVTVTADSVPPTAMSLGLTPDGDLGRPDVLVYWSSDGTLASSFLLGSVRGARAVRFALPDAALAENGFVILYSLGHREVVARFPLNVSAVRPPVGGIGGA